MPPSTTLRDEALDRDRLQTLAAALQAGRYKAATAQAEAMLADGLIHPLPLRMAATVRQRAGRFEEAIALFQRITQLAPREPAGWAALSDCQFAARRPEAALEANQAALNLAPDEPSLLCARAQILRSLSRIGEASALFQRALAANPDLFEAQMGLAMLAVEAGDWTEAAGLVRGLRARHGPSPATGWLAARIAMGLREFEAAREEIAEVLADPHLQSDQRAEALLLQGEALDALDRPAEAFDAAVAGKAIQHQLFSERAAGREGETAKLTRLARWFQTADRETWRRSTDAPALSDDAARHVFLFGFPRSGTTLLEQVLAGHPDVVALEEAPTLAAPYAEFMTTDEGLERLARLTPAEIDLWRARYWAEVRGHGVEPRDRLFVDKAPAGTLYLPLVAKLFPEAKVLFALRDPRDVVLSCLRQSFQLNAMTYAFTTLDEAARCYAACMGLAEVYRAVLPLRLLQVRHENLVQDFDAGLTQIAGFLGLTVTPEMADVGATARRRVVRTPSATQVREGVNTRGVGRWRAYAEQLGPVVKTLAPWVERFGYALEGLDG